MRIVITGGHPGPSLAVIDEIRGGYPEWEIYFIGTKCPLTRDRAISFEYKETVARKIPFINLTTGKFDRTSKLKLALSVLKIGYGYLCSLIILHRLKPNVVLGFGGYLAVPVSYAARSLGVKVLIHEQTFQMGFANRLIARVADRVLLSWENTQKVNSSWKSVVTGLPLRKAIIKAKAKIRHKRSKLPMLLIMGGSQGAHFINKLISSILDDLLDKFRVVHQVGDASAYSDFSKLMIRRLDMNQKIRDNYELHKHISTAEIGNYLAQADIIVSRAGVNTMVELLYLEKKAVLVPLLESINPEQQMNADYYAKTGLGTYIRQEEATADKLLQTISRLLKQPAGVKNGHEQKLESIEAAGKIIKELMVVADG